MLDGRYAYEQGENPYDEGEIVVLAKDYGDHISLRVERIQMRYSSYAESLFAGKRVVKIRKDGRCPHGIAFGADWFCIYPHRAGVPLCFTHQE